MVVGAFFMVEGSFHFLTCNGMTIRILREDFGSGNRKCFKLFGNK